MIHLGVFRTAKEADECVAWANLELAAGRIPDRRARIKAQLGERRTLRDEAQAWLATRVDLAEATIHKYEDIITRNAGSKLALWRLRPADVTVDDVQTHIAALVKTGAAPNSIKNEVFVLRMVLDYAKRDPNPARDRGVRLPKDERVAPDPPTAAQVAAIIQHAPKTMRLPIALLEATGMRVSDLTNLRWGDVDVAESRFRIAKGKTKSARRFVDVPPPLMEAVQALVPFDDRRIDRRVFGVTPSAVHHAMQRACQAAGIPHFHPHDLRHRHASVRVLRGDPITVVQRDLGHAKASMTLDVYSHSATDSGWGWETAEWSSG